VLVMSDLFKQRVREKRMSGTRQYSLAVRHGLSSAALSLLLHDGARINPHDTKILGLAAELGVSPAECFVEVAADVPTANDRAHSKCSQSAAGAA